MASSELIPARPRGFRLLEALAWRSPGAWRDRWRAGRLILSPAVPDLAGLALLLSIVAFVHWPSIGGQAIYARSDTFSFFYPVFSTLHQALRAGELPFWTSSIFGGFPLFAEGQIGALYPPSWLAVQLSSPLDGFVALRVFHAAMGVVGPYVLARTLGTSPLGACVAGLVFGLGSFVVGQQHHANLLAATVWMPFLLATTQAALSRRGWVGLGLLGLAGLLLGIEALATHVQPLMLTGALLVAFVLWRQATYALAELREPVPRAPAERRGRFPIRARLGRALAVLAWAPLALTIIPTLGATIGAAQLLPLLELSQESWRARGFSYADATEYSLPPTNLVTLVFPFFFRIGDTGQWSLWQAWEVVLYVGIVPLILAVAATVTVRRWPVAFFALVSVVATTVALGGYAPFGLYELLLQVPGMSVQRAPARLTLLVTLSLGILAAYGADWLAQRGASTYRGRRGERALVVLQAGVLLSLGTLVAHLVLWSAWLAAERGWGLEVIARTYLRLPQDPLQALAPLDVVQGLEAALNMANPKTALPLVLLAAFVALLVAWRELPRLAALWRGALLLIVAFDLVLFAVDFHPLVRADALAELDPAAEFVAARADLGRSLTHPDVEAVRPNRLLPERTAEVSGYSPLQLERHRWYGGAVEGVGNSLLDLWGVRWLVEPRSSPSLPSYEQVAFNPDHPLMVGGAGTSNGRVELHVPAVVADELRAVIALRGGASFGESELVGEWTLLDERGVRTVLPVRAGREVADDLLAMEDGKAAHSPVEVAARLPALGDRPASALSYAATTLTRRATIVRAEYRHLSPVGVSAVYGLTLHDTTTDDFEQVAQQAKYTPVYGDGNVRIFENRDAFPRAFVVARSIAVGSGGEAQERLLRGPFDPRREVLLEGGPSSAASAVRASSDLVPATVSDDNWRGVTVEAVAPEGGFLVLTDPYFPGWRVFVDGEESEIHRANYLFRAVALTPGSHTLRFAFDPESFRTGAVLSQTGVALALGLLAASLVGRLASGRFRMRERPRSE